MLRVYNKNLHVSNVPKKTPQHVLGKPVCLYLHGATFCGISTI